MIRIICGILGVAAIALMFPGSSYARGWSSVHRYVHPTGECFGGREVMASFYWTGRKTCTGDRFFANGISAASRGRKFGGWETGEVLSITSRSGRTISVRVNDCGPWGIAHRMGARLDLSRGAARALGMRATEYVCVR